MIAETLMVETALAMDNTPPELLDKMDEWSARAWILAGCIAVALVIVFGSSPY